MTPEILKRLCGLHMADDPSTSAPEVDHACDLWLHEQAQALGYTTWQEAYHTIDGNRLSAYRPVSYPKGTTD